MTSGCSGSPMEIEERAAERSGLLELVLSAPGGDDRGGAMSAVTPVCLA